MSDTSLPSPTPPGDSPINVCPQTGEWSVAFADPGFANELFGPQNATINQLARSSGLHIATRGSSVTLTGEAKKAGLVQSLLMQLYGLLQSGVRLQQRDVLQAYALLERRPDTELKSLFLDAVFAPSARKSVAPKTLTQREYVHALREADMTFAVGPAGTGKTYLAVAVGLSMLLAKRVRRLILTRPAVEAGERLGFLPGDMAEKVNPYLRPLYDAMHDMLEPERVAEMLESGVIEIAPLAFMRGRTLNDAFIILDEAQNTTPEQMKMFLTRLGFGSRAAVTGDITQIDLPHAPGKTQRSGLIEALDVLRGVEGIHFITFAKEDVIRHPLVGRIVEAYDSRQTYTG